MDIYFETTTNDAERSEVEQWRRTNESVDVEYVRIGLPGVYVHGINRHFRAVVGTAFRHGTLTGELSSALAGMRKARDS